ISVGGAKFIPSRYLKHFMAYQDVYYGDVGAVFEMMGTKFVVKSVEQLGRGKALMAGDEILTINGEKFKSLREFNERILFAKKGEVLTFEVLRDGEVEKFEIAVSNDANIMSQKPEKTKQETKEPIKSVQVTNVVKDVFKLQGVSFDKNLVVKKVDEGSKAANFGIKPGDKLIQVNRTEVKNYKEALNLASKESSEQVLLFRRGGFDFFFKVR
ncbi:PDZ domain-containing protein, partial [Campylobacter sp.]|uniref:PDZ domain-containing protein n=1 Tax=Campylobacter sp. TaxID=205 RepID=UPI0027115BD7|nr:PDZ domain-containing protein [Campylobacter sp.]